MQTINFKDLGVIEYGDAWELQEELLQQNLKVKAAWYNTAEAERTGETQNHLLFCTHPHVYTIGKSGHMENLLLNDERLKELDISFYKTNRGGDITYHGYGQVVAYPILDLELFYTDLGKYMRALEEAVIRTIAHFGITGERLPGCTGVWLDAAIPGKARKICAMGVRCSRWVTMHGLALNVNTDMRYFDYIVPCGIKDKTVTSIAQETGQVIDEEKVKKFLRDEFAYVFNALIKDEKLHMV